MDETVFDSLTRVLSASSRRGLLAVVGTVLLTAAGSPEALHEALAVLHTHGG